MSLVMSLPTLPACGRDSSERADDVAAAEPRAAAANAVEVLGGAEGLLTMEELERGRLDASWRTVVQMDSVAVSGTTRSPERLQDISMEAMNTAPMFLPLGGDGEGPSVFRVQILLDRALFSPGIMDGRWGKNTEKAVYWLQKREAVPATGQVDSTTFVRLVQLAGAPPRLVDERVLSAEDVQGPFVEIPDEIYQAHKLECTCYESLEEKLSERFHIVPALLRQLNPGVELNALRAGDRLRVPAVREADAAAQGVVAEIVVSVAGNYLHANDAAGRLLYHFPTTLGSGYNPEEGTAYQVNSVTPDPWWNLQPRLLHVGDPNRPPVQIPPGPNSAVGNMWIDLSKEHYGIHGTSEPQTIGYATSSGCVRLTNWDANFLGDKLKPGLPVKFKDIPPEQEEHPSHEASAQ